MVKCAMKTMLQVLGLLILVLSDSSCKPQSPDAQFVREKIPVEIRRAKPITVEIRSLSGNGMNDVGIRCPPEVWSVLTNGTKGIAVRLTSSNRADTEIGGIDLHGGGTFFGKLANVHYLFYIGGRYHAHAVVEITFSNAPPEPTPAEILIGKTPADTGL
jgi:hypothetical protein